MNLVIKSDRKWRPFVYRHEVPIEILSSEFDYQDPENEFTGFFKYKGTWYHLDQFTSTDGYKGVIPVQWNGIKNETFSSGVLIEISEDGEQYRVAYYYTISDV